jgi:hypothetical protein
VVAIWESVSLRSGTGRSRPEGLAKQEAQSEATSA